MGCGLTGMFNHGESEVKFIVYAVPMVALSLLISCTGKVSVVPYHQPVDNESPMIVDIPDAEGIGVILDTYFQTWIGTPYREGGLDRSGIDCSGFVQQTYHALFGISLPRTAKGQAGLGKKISRAELRPADLVFFKTGFFDRHVGIYRGNDQFMHVSTKRGVSLNQLSDAYWNQRFWQARRISM